MLDIRNVKVNFDRSVEPYSIDIGMQHENGIVRLDFEFDEKFNLTNEYLYFMVTDDGRTLVYPIIDNSVVIGSEITQKKRYVANIVVSKNEIIDELNKNYIVWISKDVILTITANSIITGALSPEVLPVQLQIVYDDLFDLKADLINKLESGYFKGEKGDKGDKGDTGEQGAKGDKGDTEVTKENIKTALGQNPLIQPSTAQIGQTFKVQSINEDGTLGLEAVDMQNIDDIEGQISELKGDINNLKNTVNGEKETREGNLVELLTFNNGYFNVDGSIHEPTTNNEVYSDFFNADDYDSIDFLYSTSSASESAWLAICVKDGTVKTREVIINNIRISNISPAVATLDLSLYKGKEIALCYRKFANLDSVLVATYHSTIIITEGIAQYVEYLMNNIDDAIELKNNVFPDSDILTIQHGATTSYPSNVLGLYKNAFKNGILAWECDIKPCVDGYVLCHDNDIYNHAVTSTHQTIPQGTVLISQKTVNELKSYKFGVITNKQTEGVVSGFENDTIPTLKEFLLMAKVFGATPFIEIKFTPTSQQMTDICNIIKSCGMLKKTYIICYESAQIVVGYALTNGIKNLSIIVNNGQFDISSVDSAYSWISNHVDDLDDVLFNPQTTYLSSDMVEYASSKGMRTSCWTVSAGVNHQTLLNWYNMGCTAFTVNYDNVSEIIRNSYR